MSLLNILFGWLNFGWLKAIMDEMPLTVKLTPHVGNVEVKHWDGAGVAIDGCYLQLPKPIGITIEAEVFVLAQGTLKFVQNAKVKGTRVNNLRGRECLSPRQQGKWVRDGGDPYQGKTAVVDRVGVVPPFNAVDSPGQCLSDPKLESIEVEEQFRTYLLWKARPGKKRKTKGAAGWNVIGCVEWSWSGKAVPTADLDEGTVVCGVRDGGYRYAWKRTTPPTQQAKASANMGPPITAGPDLKADDWHRC
jgi:hypothetical protein